MTNKKPHGRLRRLTAGGTALLLGAGMLATATVMAPGAQGAPVGAGFVLDDSDLRFILKQIQIAETHAVSNNPNTLGNIVPATSVLGNGPNDLPSPLVPWGLRETSGHNNNLFAGRSGWGAADELFPNMSSIRRWRDTEALGTPFNLAASNYQTRGNSVADSAPRTISNLIVDQSPSNPAAVDAAGPGATPEPNSNSFFIPNVTPDGGLSAPYNSVFTLFGQFFDHGLDLVGKSGTESVVVPLQPDDPLFVPGAQTNFMVASRTILNAGLVATNTTTPYVDQNQTYTSHPSHQVFLRGYTPSGTGPVSTGKLADGAIAGNIANWGEIKAQAANVLGIQLVDTDVLNVPLLLTDEYGRFLRGPNGFPQLVQIGGGVVEGDPNAPISTANAERTGHAFLDDIAHNAVPTTPGYDPAILAAHFITGDGRGNENIGLTAIHSVFHSEHNRLADDIDLMLTNTTDAALAAGFNAPGWGYGERLFQAAKFVTEMQYQHLVFEEFSRKVQPAIRVFAGYDPTLNGSIVSEFAHAVYRFGHSMLTESVDRVNADGTRNDMRLLDAFLNPQAFNDGGSAGQLTAAQAVGSIVRGMSEQVGNELDEFVTGALRNSLLGLPLDLATLNLVRGRDTGTPSLNDARQAFSAVDPALAPYGSWAEFALELRHPGSIVNFIAAYGNHPTITGTATVAGKRAAAQALVDAANALEPSAVAFMTSNATGINDVDLWSGGLAEKQTPFGGLLGTTFNHVFQTQMEDLQEGDRFYYLDRTAGLNLLTQLEGNSLAELMMRNSDAENLPADVFSRPGMVFDLRNTGNFCNVVADDPATPYDEATILTKAADGTIRYVVGPVDHVVLGGTNFDDRIFSDLGDDTIHGNDGNDWVQGGAGVDNIVGGAGDDILNDSGQDDVIKGGPGHDVINSGPGIDLNQGGTGSDFVTGGTGGVETLAGPGNDLVFAGLAADVVLGDDGDDWIEGGASADGLTGDAGAPLEIDLVVPGNDVLIGGSGADADIGEGGGDINVAGDGVDDFDGDFGYDWHTHKGSLETEADLANPLVLPPTAPLPNQLMDKFALVEGLSGFTGNDTLSGDDVLTLAANPAVPGSDQEITAADRTRIGGLADLLTTAVGDAQTVLADNPVGSLTTLANILIGGPGDDTLQGRAGNDLIDGDAWLNVQLQVPDLAGTATATKFVDGLTDIRQEMVNGLMNPADVRIVRSIVRTPGGTDIAVFQGLEADYTVAVVGDTVTVTDNLAVPVGRLNDGVDILRGIETLRFLNIDGVTLTPVATDTPVVADPPLAIDPPNLVAEVRENNSVPRAACTAGAATAPQNVSASAGVNSATVSWSPPSSNGGSQLLRYEVQMASDPNGPWSNVDTNASSPKVVSGLVPNDTVWFRVRAVTANGDGPYAVSNPVAANAPSSGGSGGGAGAGGGSGATGGSSSGGSSSGGSSGGGSSSAGSNTPPASPVVSPTTPQAGTAAVTLVVAGNPSKRPGTAPAVSAKVGQAVTLKLKGLPKKTALSVKVKVNGAWTILGVVKTSKIGRATLPTFRVDKAGTYPIQLTTAKGVKYYVKVIVS